MFAARKIEDKMAELARMALLATNYWPRFMRPANGSEWNGRASQPSDSQASQVRHDSFHRNKKAASVANSGSERSKRNERNKDSLRGLMWVDAIGGFLVCLNDEITIGQAVPGNDVDIPILGDLSRHHATIQRSGHLGDEYTLVPLGRMRVNQHEVSGPFPLHDGDELELGTGIEMRFRQSHPLSNSARLNLLTRHRTDPSADGVILLGQTCVFGPSPQNHVVCRDLSHDVILSRHDGGMFRYQSKLAMTTAGKTSANKGIVDWGSRLEGDGFTLMLERL